MRGAIGAAALGQGLAHHRAGQRGRAALRLGVQGGQQEGLHQPLPQRPSAGHRPRRRVCPRPAHSRPASGQVVGRPACPARGAPGEQSTRAAARHWAGCVQRSPVATSTKIEARPRSGPTSLSARADRLQIADGRPGCPTAPGDCRCRWSGRDWRRNRSGSARPPAAAASMSSTSTPRRRQAHGGREPGKPGADDIGVLSGRPAVIRSGRATARSTAGAALPMRRALARRRPARASIARQDLGVDRAHQPRRARGGRRACAARTASASR